MKLLELGCYFIRPYVSLSSLNSLINSLFSFDWIALNLQIWNLKNNLAILHFLISYSFNILALRSFSFNSYYLFSSYSFNILAIRSFSFLSYSSISFNFFFYISRFFFAYSFIEFNFGGDVILGSTELNNKLGSEGV